MTPFGTVAALGHGQAAMRGRSALRGLLYSSILSGGLLLVNGAPAYAVPCSTAVNAANSTQCIGGATADTLDYEPITDGNAGYAGGDFTLQLQSHDVDTTVSGGNGIEFGGVQTGVGNDGTILLNGNSNIGAGLNGIVSTATGATTTIEVNDTSSVSGDAGAGINATSTGGNITVTTQVNTMVTGALGAGIIANATAAGNVVVNAQGGVDGAVGAGIEALAAQGTVGVTTGTKEINGGLSGIRANADNNSVTVTTGTGLVIATGGTGIDATGDSVTVSTGGIVTGTGGAGINAVADNGATSVTTAASVLVSGTNGAGINATATGAVTVQAGGGVTGAGTNGAGINAASSGGGVVGVTTAAGFVVTGSNGDGITASTTGAGTVTVNANSRVIGTGAGNDGIEADGVDGAVIVNTFGGGISGGQDGIDAFASNSSVTVTTGTGLVQGSAGQGILASGNTASVTANGDVTGSANGINALGDSGNVDVKSVAAATITGTAGDGINANATGATGNTDVEALGVVTGGANGIWARSNAGTVEVTTGTATVEGTAAIGIFAQAAGNATVDAKGSVTGGTHGISATAINGDAKVTTASSFTVKGSGGDGINAEASMTGNVTVSASSIVSGATNGINANATSGTVFVESGPGPVTGSAGSGIDATASSTVTVDVSGEVSGSVHGINAASSAAGNVEVETFGSLIGPPDLIKGNGGAGINASTTGAGLVTITNTKQVQGTVAGIIAASGGGAIQINNDRNITNATLNEADLAIRTSGGPTTIDNSGTGILNGRVETGALADTLNNNNLWATQGDNDFGGGTDIVNNNLTLFAADDLGVAETTRFLNLETFNNDGTIDLQDQTAGDGSNVSDRLETSGNFFPAGGGSLDIDAFLGGAGSVADVLVVGGSISGTTQIFVTDTNAGGGGFDPAGILVVDVSDGGTADATNVTLAGGPIDKGLFSYDLLFDDPTNNYFLVGLPDQEVFETTAAVASAQEIFRETADAWSTRQENLRDLLSAKRTITSVADPGTSVGDAPMGSLWVSALGSWMERDDDASFALLNANLDFDLSYKQDIYGVVGGADFRASMGTHTSLLFGVMAGYVDSKLDFDDSDTSIDTNGATVGGYAALMSNGFFATVLVKADLLDMEYAAAGDSDNANVTSYGARGDLGFRFGDTGLFVEPMLSMDAFSTEIDEFEITGTEIDAGTNESFRGGAGLRGGFGGEDVRASATARVWNVFSTDNEVDIPGLTISDDDLEGIYGDVSAQIDVSLNSNATIYLKGGVLFSDDVTKPNASGGFALYW